MYQSLLTRKYLTSKVMPLLASLAVALCTAMVLIVWSVMGGFLTMLLAQGSSIMGDAAISRPVVGLPYYEELIEALEARPEIEAATPTIESLGMLALPTGEPRFVQVIGIRPEDFDRVTSFSDNLWWRPVGADEAGEGDFRRAESTAPFMPDLLEAGRTLTEPDPKTGIDGPAMVMGIEINPYNERLPDGTYEPNPYFFSPDHHLTISVLPLSRLNVAIQLESRSLPVANEYQTGMYEVDSKTIYVPFEVLQSMLKLDAAQRVALDYTPGEVVVGEDGLARIAPPRTTETVPARATSILIRGAEGVSPRRAEGVAEDVYEAFALEHDGYFYDEAGVWRKEIVYTWEEKPDLKGYINAVRKETGLVLVLFVFISFTAVFLVGAIFWSMVSEKTRDIGILRAVGAGRLGVAWLFVRYGLVIGVVGSVVGGIIAWLIVTNINPIHEWMGSALGLYVWDPSVYYFTEIPSHVEPLKATIVLVGGVLFSALGALIPAARAASMNPVKALRFE